MQGFRTIISSKPKFSAGFEEIWQYRELFYFFTWRDIKVKYKQTALGIGWALLQPLLLMGIFWFIFARTLKISVPGMPYPVYAFSGLILWGLFSGGISHAGDSILTHSAIIKKIYFPRLIIPLSAILVSLVDFGFAFLLFIGILIGFGQPVEWTALLFFPLGMIWAFAAALGLGSLLAALNVKYRDFRYLLPFGIQILFFASPVIYSMQSVPDGWLKKALYLNPFAGALEIFRLPLHAQPPDSIGLLTSAASALVLLLLGLWYFRKTENYFADIA